MAFLYIIFVVLQVSLLLFMALHDWVHVPPLTNIRDIEQLHSKKQRIFTSILTSLCVLIPLRQTLISFGDFSKSTIVQILGMYGFIVINTIIAWWIPYFFGSSAHHKRMFSVYKNTHTFLPKRGDNVIPNTLHLLLHFQVWSCFLISVYYLITLL